MYRAKERSRLCLYSLAGEEDELLLGGQLCMVLPPRDMRKAAEKFPSGPFVMFVHLTGECLVE
jgi:hypothetical protein